MAKVSVGEAVEIVDVGVVDVVAFVGERVASVVMRVSVACLTTTRIPSATTGLRNAMFLFRRLAPEKHTQVTMCTIYRRWVSIGRVIAAVVRRSIDR